MPPNPQTAKTIFFCPTGPLMQFDASVSSLSIEDLNPQQKMVWRVTRFEMAKIAIKALIASVMP